MAKKYQIIGGFNIVLDKPWKGKYGQAIEINLGNGKTQDEVRFEPTDSPISKSDLPKHTAFDWLVEKGVLVELTDEIETPETEVVDA